VTAGYFVSYEADEDIEKIVSLCVQEKWGDVANLDADFLLFHFDAKTRQISILTSHAGKFPCYFHVGPSKLVVSTSFYEVFQSVKTPELDIERTLEFIYRDTHVSDKTLVKDLFLLYPGAVGHFTKKRALVRPLLKTGEFLAHTPARYTSLEAFSEEFLKSLDRIIGLHLKKIGGIQYCSEISSGFDSSLISYLLQKTPAIPWLAIHK